MPNTNKALISFTFKAILLLSLISAAVLAGAKVGFDRGYEVGLDKCLLITIDEVQPLQMISL